MNSGTHASVMGNRKNRAVVETVAQIVFTICAFFAVLAVVSITLYMIISGTPATDCRQNAFGQHSRSVFLVFGSKSVYLINNKHFWAPLFPFLAIIFASFFRFMQANVSPTFISIRAFPIICV